MTRRLFAFAALAIALAISSRANAADAGATDAPTVSARADRSEAHVGDVVTVTVTAVAPRSLPVNLPTQLALDPFTVLDRSEAERDLGDGRVQREFVLKVAAYEPGDVTLPEIPLTYIGRGGAVLSARSAPLAIKVKSLLANEPDPQLKENVGPFEVREQNRWLIYGLAALGVALLGAVIGAVVWRRIRARALVRPAPPPRPAHEVALERLDRLGVAGFLENADYRPFYFTLSEIVRDYLGARYGFDSLELTTEELMGELRKRAPRELILAEVEGWLAACDLVKFAKVSPSAAEARGAFELALRIVATTRPRPEPQVVPGAAAGQEARDGDAGATRAEEGHG